MDQTAAPPTSRCLPALPGRERLRPRPQGNTPRQAAAGGFLLPEMPTRPETRARCLSRRGGVERIDRILAGLLALYEIRLELDPAAGADPK